MLRCGDKRAVAASDLGQQAGQAASKAGVPPAPEQETTFSLRVAYGGARHVRSWQLADLRSPGLYVCSVAHNGRSQWGGSRRSPYGARAWANSLILGAASRQTPSAHCSGQSLKPMEALCRTLPSWLRLAHLLFDRGLLSREPIFHVLDRRDETAGCGGVVAAALQVLDLGLVVFPKVAIGIGKALAHPAMRQ